MILNKIKNENTYFLLSLVLLSLLTVIFYMPGSDLISGYDAFFHYNRINALIEALKDGSFPIYIEYDAANGYGYGTKLFYSDFMLLPIAGLAMITNLSFAYKVFVFSALALSGYFTSVAVRKFFQSDRVGYISGLLVAFGLFHLVGLFERSAFGEALSYIFIPIIAIGLWEIVYGNQRKWYVFSLGFGLLLLSHLITSLLTALIAFVFILCNIKRLFNDRKRLYSLIKGGLLVVIISAYALFPLFEQLQTTEFFLKYHKELVRPSQQKLPFVDVLKGVFGGYYFTSKPSVFGGGLGCGLFLTALLSLRLLLIKKTRTVAIRKADICFIIGFVLLVATSQVWPWGRFPFTLLKNIQFPWRLFEYVTFFWSIAAAVYLISLLERKKEKYYLLASTGVVLLLLLQIYFNSWNFHHIDFGAKASSKPNVDNLYNLGSLEYTPAKYVLYEKSFWNRIGERKDMAVSQQTTTLLSTYKHQKSRISFNIDTRGHEDIIEIPLFFYEGYTAEFDGQSIPLKESDHGLVEILIKGKGDIVIDFTGTFIQKYSFFITCLGFLLVIFCFIRSKKSKKTD